MSDAPEREHELERLFDHTLRGLPHRVAPATLQARVLGALQRRAAQPWWRRSFAHWPLPARAAFVALCVGCAALALLGGHWTQVTLDYVPPADALMALPVRQLTGLLATATALAAVPTRLIPPSWFYSALIAGAALYAMLFGLGAVAYRTLFLKPLGR